MFKVHRFRLSWIPWFSTLTMMRSRGGSPSCRMANDLVLASMLGISGSSLPCTWSWMAKPRCSCCHRPNPLSPSFPVLLDLADTWASEAGRKMQATLFYPCLGLWGVWTENYDMPLSTMDRISSTIIPFAFCPPPHKAIWGHISNQTYFLLNPLIIVKIEGLQPQLSNLITMNNAH